MAPQSETVRPLVAGNWKMNGTRASLGEIDALAGALAKGVHGGVDVMICPPATLVSALADRAKGTALAIGGQDCHAKVSGAHTGDVSAEMLKDAGATAVIVGHSERRADHGESDAIVRAKCEAAHRAGLVAIVCVGETADERKTGRTLDVVAGQLQGSLPDGATATTTIVAYEPVWAIGTGLTPTAGDVAEVHGMIRKALVARYGQEGARMRLLYGGSVKASNAVELMAVANVNGALVGGASLKAADFVGILDAYR
jgi:triosephosphate isomerase